MPDKTHTTEPAQTRAPRTRNSGALTAADVLAVQRTAGNRAAQQLIAQRRVQAKLTVGPVDDPFEREADRMADAVLSSPLPIGEGRGVGNDAGVKREATPEEDELQTKPLAARITPLAQRDAMPEEDEEVQRQAEEEDELAQTKRSSDGSFDAGADVEQRIARSKGAGSPLLDATRTEMESKFGADFSRVRVHAGSEAAQLNRDLSAQAFTHGSDVYFGEGKFAPASGEGKHLLAHELTHVVQQNPSAEKPKIINEASTRQMRSTQMKLARFPLSPITKQTDVNEIPFSERLWISAQLAIPLMPQKAIDEFKQIFDPQNVLILSGYLVAQTLPYVWVAELLAWGLSLNQAYRIGIEICKYVQIVEEAKHYKDLVRAAHHLANGINWGFSLILTTVLATLGSRVTRKIKKPKRELGNREPFVGAKTSIKIESPAYMVRVGSTTGMFGIKVFRNLDDAISFQKKMARLSEYLIRRRYSLPREWNDALNINIQKIVLKKGGEIPFTKGKVAEFSNTPLERLFFKGGGEQVMIDFEKLKQLKLDYVMHYLSEFRLPISSIRPFASSTFPHTDRGDERHDKSSQE